MVALKSFRISLSCNVACTVGLMIGMGAIFKFGDVEAEDKNFSILQQGVAIGK